MTRGWGESAGFILIRYCSKVKIDSRTAYSSTNIPFESTNLRYPSIIWTPLYRSINAARLVIYPSLSSPNFHLALTVFCESHQYWGKNLAYFSWYYSQILQRLEGWNVYEKICNCFATQIVRAYCDHFDPLLTSKIAMNNMIMYTLNCDPNPNIFQTP